MRAIKPPQGEVKGKQNCKTKKELVFKTSLSSRIQLCLKPVGPPYFFRFKLVWDEFLSLTAKGFVLNIVSNHGFRLPLLALLYFPTCISASEKMVSWTASETYPTSQLLCLWSCCFLDLKYPLHIAALQSSNPPLRPFSSWSLPWECHRCHFLTFCPHNALQELTVFPWILIICVSPFPSQS